MSSFCILVVRFTAALSIGLIGLLVEVYNWNLISGTTLCNTYLDRTYQQSHFLGISVEKLFVIGIED